MATQAQQLYRSRRRVESWHLEAVSSAGCSLAKESDTTLVTAAESGYSEAFEILVRRHQAKILSVALRFTRNYEAAEDIAQQTFQKAFVHLRQFKRNSSFSTWLTRIAMNEALMWLRRNRRLAEVPLEKPNVQNETVLRLDPPDPAPNPEEICLQLERKRIVSAAINKLTPTVRSALELRELAEVSTRETARLMGISVAAVKARLFHGRRKLRDRLKHYVGSAWMRELSSDSGD
jgi:RNA polymerase sigma-70 factor (ECF subfamily)